MLVRILEVVYDGHALFKCWLDSRCNAVVELLKYNLMNTCLPPKKQILPVAIFVALHALAQVFAFQSGLNFDSWFERTRVPR